MLRSTHSLQLRWSHNNGVRCHPHGETADQQKDHVLTILHITMRSLDPRHTIMQIGVCTEEQQTNHNRLNDEQPSHDSTHQRNTHLLAESINFLHQPIACERQRNQTEDCDKHCHITNPVIMSSFLFRFSGEVMICGVSTNDSTTEYDVTQNSMNTDRVPKGGMNNVPDIS